MRQHESANLRSTFLFSDYWGKMTTNDWSQSCLIYFIKSRILLRNYISIQSYWIWWRESKSAYNDFLYLTIILNWVSFHIFLFYMFWNLVLKWNPQHWLTNWQTHSYLSLGNIFQFPSMRLPIKLSYFN